MDRKMSFIEKVSVVKKNDTYLKVSASPSVMQELKEFFTFDVPGAKFHPKYKNKMWDGKISLYSMFTKELYVGLLYYLKKFCEQEEYELDLSEYEATEEDIPLDDIISFLDSLQLASNGEPIEIRPYQIEAIHAALTSKRKVLLSPTGSGKSMMIYSMIRWQWLNKKKQLIIVPTTSLVEQLYSDFADYSSINRWNVQKYVHKIYSGFEKINTHDVVISTWQSLQNLPDTFFEKFDCIYGDECHLFTASVLKSVMEKCTNSSFKIGTSGTLSGTKTHKLVLEGLFGPVYQVTSSKKLMDTGYLSNIKIRCIIIDHSDEDKKAVQSTKKGPKLSYQEEVDFIVKHEKRNKFIRNLALSLEGNTLILFQFVEKHGKVLYDLIEARAPANRKLFFVAGEVEATERESIRAIVEKADNAIVVASYGTFSTGVNIKNLHNIIMASPSKSRIRNLQSIGRGLRKTSEKDTCYLYDIGDNLSSTKRNNYALAHAVERIKIYAEEDFEYKIINMKW